MKSSLGLHPESCVMTSLTANHASLTASAEEVYQPLLVRCVALLYVATVPFQGTPIFGRSLPFMVGVLYLILTLSSRLLRPTAHSGRVHVAASMAALIYTLFCGVSYFWSVDPQASLTRYITLLTVVATAWFLASDMGNLRVAVPVAYVGGSIALAFAVLSAVASVDDRRTSQGNGNDVALILLVGVGCAIWLALYRGRLVRLFALAAIPVLTYATLMTGSRTAVLGGATMLACGAIALMWRRRWKLLAQLSLLGAVGGAVVRQLPASALPERLSSISTALESDGLSNRTVIWQVALDHGLTVGGVGFGGGPAYTGLSIGSAVATHNVWLECLLETGIIGLALFGAVTVASAVAGRMSEFRDLLMFIAPVLFVGSLTLSLEVTRVLWFVIALAWSVDSRSRTGIGEG